MHCIVHLLWFPPLNQLAGAGVQLLHQVAAQHRHQRLPHPPSPLRHHLLVFLWKGRVRKLRCWLRVVVVLGFMYNRESYIITKQIPHLTIINTCFVLRRTPKKFTLIQLLSLVASPSYSLFSVRFLSFANFSIFPFLSLLSTDALGSVELSLRFLDTSALGPLAAWISVKILARLLYSSYSEKSYISH